MFLSRFGSGVVLLAFGLACFGADGVKPECNRKNAGKLWPQAANRDRGSLSKLARCGELQICTRGVWRYHWESLTVRVDQLRGGAKFQKPAGCEVSPERVEEASVPAATGTK
jgi:hypothetical protein